jgi:O-acetyl-ADP-ribose deacetylase (regulator of RNase III)
MKIVYRKGDLLDSGLKFIAHGCNAQRQMGSGIAWSIRCKWPEVFEVYRKGDMTMGNVVLAQTNDGIFIMNCITQEFFGRDPDVRYVSYDAIAKAVRKINELLAVSQFADSIHEVGFPKIGAGLANGDWSVIEKIIESEAKHFQPVVYTLE